MLSEAHRATGARQPYVTAGIKFHAFLIHKGSFPCGTIRGDLASEGGIFRRKSEGGEGCHPDSGDLTQA